MTDRDLFGNFDRMRREMDELLGGVFERTGMGRRRVGFSPAIDVAYTSDPPTAVVTVDVAGISTEDLEIEIDGRQLVIAGERGPAAVEAAVYQQVEIERGPFRRVVTLARDAHADQATASYEEGMLRIEVPLRVSESGARTVPIDGGER